MSQGFDESMMQLAVFSEHRQDRGALVSLCRRSFKQANVCFSAAFKRTASSTEDEPEAKRRRSLSVSVDREARIDDTAVADALRALEDCCLWGADHPPTWADVKNWRCVSKYCSFYLP